MGTDIEVYVITKDSLEGAYQRATESRKAQESGYWFRGVKEYSTLDEYVERLESLKGISDSLTEEVIARYQALAPIMGKRENYPIVVVHTDDPLFQKLLGSEGFLTLGDAILSSRGLESGSYDS